MTWELPAVDSPPPVRGPLAIVGVTVVPMSTEAALPDHTVVVEAGRISRLEPSARADASGLRVVDRRGDCLLPGLAVHVPFRRPGRSG